MIRKYMVCSMPESRLHSFGERFFVDGHLNRDVRELVVNGGIGNRLDGGVVLGVFMILGDWTEGLCDDTDNEEVEELEAQLAPCNHY